jgi:ankyrin repeat protein
MLISYGADIHIRDAYNQTALMQLENTEIAQMLIDNGAIINAQDHENQTALFINVRENNIDMVKLLLKNGADVSIRDDHNDTMLMYSESVEIAKMLIDNGADINETNGTGQTAIVFSSIAGDVEMVKFLLDNGASLFNCKKNISLMKKIEKDRKGTIKKIVKIYSDENYKDDDDKINENIKEKQQLVESYEKVLEILKGHILYNLLNEFGQLITVKNLKSTLICIKDIIKRFGIVDTFKKDFKLEIKRKKEQLNVEDKSNYWNREIASLVGEILKLF